MTDSGQAQLRVERVASRPVLAMPDGGAARDGQAPGGTTPAAPDDGAAGGFQGAGAVPPPGRPINLTDLKIIGDPAGLAGADGIEGVADGWASAVGLLSLISRLEAGPMDPVLARLIVVLRDRLTAHLETGNACAVERAVDQIAAEDQELGAGGVISHSRDRGHAARRLAVGYLAAERYVSKKQVWRELFLAESLAQMPSAQAAATQGLLSRDKATILTREYAKIPPHMATAGIELGLTGVMLDATAYGGSREIARMLAPLWETGAKVIAGQVARHAKVTVQPLGAGMAQLTVVDRAEHIEAIWAAVTAAARTATRHGLPGRLGQLRAEVLANWARDALRTRQVPTATGEPMPIEAYHGTPARLTAFERPAGRLLPGKSATTIWELPAAGVLTGEQTDALRDDPAWEGLVAFTPLLAQDDPRYAAARDQVTHAHDPPARVMRYLALRDGSQCRAPFCDEDGDPPDDAHHVESFADTGTTSLDGLILVHSTCHRDIHQGWRVENLGEGIFAFTDRHGNTYTSHPRGIRPAEPEGGNTPEEGPQERAPHEQPSRPGTGETPGGEADAIAS